MAIAELETGRSASPVSRDTRAFRRFSHSKPLFFGVPPKLPYPSPQRLWLLKVHLRRSHIDFGTGFSALDIPLVGPGEWYDVCTAYRLVRRSPSVNMHPSSDVLLSLPMWPLPPPFPLLPLFCNCLFPAHCSFLSAASFPNISPFTPTAHCSPTVPCISTVSFAPTAPAIPIVVPDGADADGEGMGRCMCLSPCPCFVLAFWVRFGSGGEGRGKSARR